MSINLLNHVWNESQHKGGDLLVLLALADNADDDSGECYPSVRYLARKARLDRSSVQRSLRKLCASGEVEIIEEGGRIGGTRRANLYRVNAPFLMGRKLPPVSPMRPQPREEEQALSESG